MIIETILLMAQAGQWELLARYLDLLDTLAGTAELSVNVQPAQDKEL